MQSNLKPGPNNPVKINALSQALLLREIYENPCSHDELVEATGLGLTTVRNYLIALRKQKLVRIGAWDVDKKGAVNIPCFEWAPDKKDVPKPIKTVAQRCAEYRQRRQIRKLANGLTNQTQTCETSCSSSL